jgi:hypothetical protein
MKSKHIIYISIFIILFVGCKQKSDKGELNRLLNSLKIDTSMVITNKNVISENDIPYDTLKRRINLYKFNKVQKSLIINRLEPLNQKNNYGAYLYLSENRVSKINTLVIYTDSDLGDLIYLVNFKDTMLVDYLYSDGNYGYPINQTNDEEIIEGFDQRFEFHSDTVYKIKNRIIRHDFHNEAKKNIEYIADSIIVMYKIEQNGKFTKIHYDSIPGSKPELLPR